MKIIMHDDFVRALNKFNSRFCFNNKKSSIKEINQINCKNDQTRKTSVNKLKEDLELHYIHNSNNKICQKILTLPLNKKSDKLNNYSDKLILPVSILRTLEKGSYSNEVEHPYTFSIKNLKNNYITHACVLEFSSDEGIILVSDNIKENLGITETTGVIRLLIAYASLPKCDFIKFESLNENTKDVKYMKILLENELSINYSTLSLGDYVHINHLNFYISELEPDNAVSLINTDINVDICELKTSNQQHMITSANNNDLYQIITIDTMVNDTIQNEMKKYKLDTNYNILELIKKDKASINISLTSNKLDDLLIYVSFPPYILASEETHHLFFDGYKKEIVINKDTIKKCMKIHFICFLKEHDPNYLEHILNLFFPHIIYIAISSTSESSLHYSLSLKLDTDFSSHKNESNNNNTNKDQMDDITNNNIKELRKTCMTNQKYVKCENCFKEILESNMCMHTIYCLKNISLCNICKKNFKKNEILKHIHCDICNDGMHVNNKNRHNLIWHTKIKCLCDKYFYRKQFIFHQKLFCPKKIIYCLYCNIFTTSSMNIFNEDYILGSFLDKYDSNNSSCSGGNDSITNVDKNDKVNGNNNSFTNKSIDYYHDLINNNFNYFLKYLINTEHEKYCGSKSIKCTICKINLYRNKYFSHLNLFHNMDKVLCFEVITKNVDMNDTHDNSNNANYMITDNNDKINM